MPWLTPYPMHPVGDRLWIMLEHAIYETPDGRERIHVPRGFLTDLASIPRVAQGIVQVNGLHRPAAIVHDLGFVLQDRPLMAVHGLFLEGMREQGVSWIARHLMFAAVVAGGWVAWRENAAARDADMEAFLGRYNIGRNALPVNEYLARQGIPPVLTGAGSVFELLRRYRIDPAGVKLCAV